MMERIVSVTTVNEKGEEQTWKGRGRCNVVLSRQPMDDTPVTYVYIYLTPEEEIVGGS